MTKLTWDDLLTENPATDVATLFDDWQWLLKDEFRPLAWSKFGDCFLERRDGSVEMLDVVDGTVRKLAASRDEFYSLINMQENQEEWLMSLLVFDLHERELVPKPGECYAFTIHPLLGGKLVADNVMVMSLRVWCSMSGQLHQQLHDKPKDFIITGFRVKQ
jgi:T6SS immunity protein Tdi1, C-terminal